MSRSGNLAADADTLVGRAGEILTRCRQGRGRRALGRIAWELTARSPARYPGDEGPVDQRMLDAALLALQMSEGAIVVVTESGHQGAIAQAGTITPAVDELHFALGEGPVLDAWRLGVPVEAPDLTRCTGRWPAFAAAAVALGVRGAWAAPLTPGCGFVLSCYATGTGRAPGWGQAVDLRAAVAAVLEHRLGGATPGALPPGLERSFERRQVVHQAVGIVAAEMEGDRPGALAVLRATAWGEDRSLYDLAADIVARRG